MAIDDQRTRPPEPTTTALTPTTTVGQRLRAIAAGAQPMLDRLDAIIAEKRKAVPEARRAPAPATIAAPAALHYALLGDGDEVAELRKMFENLLVASMDRDTAASAHPAFVSMIAQLTPDEARILRSIDRDEYPLDDVYDSGPGGDGRLIGSRTQLGLGIGIDEARQQQYLSNLDRLGILRSGPSVDKDVHTALAVASWTKAPVPGGLPSAKAIAVTPFGRQFLDTCVRARSR